MQSLSELIANSPVLVEAEKAYAQFVGCPALECIGSGIGLMVTATELHGKEYAVRTFASSQMAQEEMLTRLTVLELGLGRLGLEQLTAFSTEEKVIVTERMYGRDIESVSLADAECMEQSQFDALAITIDSAIKDGIAIDESPNNIFYEPNKGFGLVDYTLPFRELSVGRTLKSIGQAMMWLGHDLETFNTTTSLALRKRAIRMVTQSGLSILPQQDYRALAKTSDEWLERCF